MIVAATPRSNTSPKKQCFLATSADGWLRELSQEIRDQDPRLPERDEHGRWRSHDSLYLSGTRCQPGQDTYARYKPFATIPEMG
jgi:hypothetical protein